MPDVPETRDLFYPCDEHRVTYGTGEALLIGHDLEADILVTDDAARVDALEARLRDIDPAAFDAPDSYWASIVEQIRAEQF